MRVLVTRPQPGAARTAARLRAMGHDPVLLPLSRTVAMDDPAVDAKEQVAGAYAVTSAAALEHWQPSGMDHRAIPLYAVGSGTAAKAAEAGFSDIREGPGAGRDLARMIVADTKSGRVRLSATHPLVYVAGRVRKDAFESELAAGGVPFTTVEVYDTVNLSYSTDFLKQFLSEKPFDAVLLYSANAATRFFEAIYPHTPENILKNITYFCISENVAAVVLAFTAARCRVAAHPNEQILLSLL